MSEIATAREGRRVCKAESAEDGQKRVVADGEMS
jgi:hypothetical protein